MPDVRNDEDRTVESGADREDTSAALRKNVRKPYGAPHLRYLGSVREITAGNVTAASSEGMTPSRKSRGSG
jgi:hypothetical protein